MRRNRKIRKRLDQRRRKLILMELRTGMVLSFSSEQELEEEEKEKEKV